MQCASRAPTHAPAAIDAMRTPSISRKGTVAPRIYLLEILCIHGVRYPTLAATGLRRSCRWPGRRREGVVERACTEGERDSKVGPDATNAWGVPAWRVANLKDVLNPVLDRTACSIQGPHWPLPLYRHLFPLSRQACYVIRAPFYATNKQGLGEVPCEHAQHTEVPREQHNTQKYLESTRPARAHHGQLTGMHNVAASIQRCLGLLCQSAFAPCHACARAHMRAEEGVSAS